MRPAGAALPYSEAANSPEGSARGKVPLEPSEPGYLQVARRLRAEIYAGNYPAGSMLPSTNIVAGDWGISRDVVQRAFGQLEMQGMVTPAVGVGTVVREQRPWKVTVTWASPAGAGALVLRSEREDPAVRSASAAGRGEAEEAAELVILSAEAIHAAMVAASLLQDLGAGAVTSLRVTKSAY